MNIPSHMKYSNDKFHPQKLTKTNDGSAIIKSNKRRLSKWPAVLPSVVTFKRQLL